MNLNSKKQNHTNYCYVASKYFIPDLERMDQSKKKDLLENTHPDDPLYAKYICANCSVRRTSVAKKDPANKHYGCIKIGCCPLPFHWDLCSTCIQNKYFPLTPEDPKRKMDAAKFQRTFSRLPEDIQNRISEYIPTAFALARISGRLFLEKTFRNGSREIERHLQNQSKKTMMNIHGALICIGFAENLSRTSLTDKHKYIRLKTREFYEYLSNAHRSTIICDEDFWRLRIHEGIRLLLRRNEILGHIKKLLCPSDIRQYCVTGVLEEWGGK